MESEAAPEGKRAKLAKEGAPDAAQSVAARLAALDLERHVTAPLAKSEKSCTVLSLKILEVAVDVFSDYFCKLVSAGCSQGWMSRKLNPWIHPASVLLLQCLVRS